MTQVNHALPKFKITEWYEAQTQGERKEIARTIMIKAGVSNTYVYGWLRGTGIAKKKEHLQVLEQITGIASNELFQFVENETV